MEQARSMDGPKGGENIKFNLLIFLEKIPKFLREGISVIIVVTVDINISNYDITIMITVIYYYSVSILLLLLNLLSLILTGAISLISFLLLQGDWHPLAHLILVAFLGYLIITYEDAMLSHSNLLNSSNLPIIESSQWIQLYRLLGGLYGICIVCAVIYTSGTSESTKDYLLLYAVQFR